MKIEDNTIAEGDYITKKTVNGAVHLNPDRHAHDLAGKMIVLDNADITYFPVIEKSEGVIIRDSTKSGHFPQMLGIINKPAIILDGSYDLGLNEGEPISIEPTTEGNGRIVRGRLKPEDIVPDYSSLPKTKTGIYTLCSYPETIKRLKDFDLAGVGIARSEFMNAFTLAVHPQAIRDYDLGKLKDDEAKERIESWIESNGHNLSARELYVESIFDNVRKISEHAMGKRINYRLFDFRSDDAINFLGGNGYEPEEKNPMMGYRGTTRLINDEYRDALNTELEIIRKVKEELGANINVLAPFVRTPKDGEKLVELVKDFGLQDVDIGMMIEVPNNFTSAHRYADLFDFFVTGPMDLTQSIFMADRERGDMTHYCGLKQDGQKDMLETFFMRLKGQSKDVWIGEYELFEGMGQYLPHIGNNRVHLTSLPHKIEKATKVVYNIEKKLGI